MATEFSFSTVWRLAAAQEQVWEALTAPQDWPSWWPSFRDVRGLSVTGSAASPPTPGAGYRCTVVGVLPYALTFDVVVTGVETPTRMAGNSAGELVGYGSFELEQRGEVVRVSHTWVVRVTKPWLAPLASLTAPLLVWNHHLVMDRGARGLAERLGVPLLTTDNTSSVPGSGRAAAVVGVAVGALALRRLARFR